ncbi:MAG: hypothetical protein QM778_15380 [Myxococcales bacterium]
MALTRREWLSSLPWIAALSAACGEIGRQPVREERVYRELRQTKGGARPDRVLVFTPDTEQTRALWTGLSDEIGKVVQLIAVQIESRHDAWVMAKAIQRYEPAALVLVNNPTVAAYRDYQRQHTGRALPPAVIVMTSLLEKSELDLRNATGIRYEVPLVTAITSLRRLITLPITRVGVIRREGFRGFVQAEAALARQEKVTVVPEVLSASFNASDIKRALRNLKEHAQAIWVLNDDRLLSEALLSQGWLVGLNQRPWIPTIVGVSSLMSADGPFGDVAFLPDHVALGTQAADILFDAMDNGWQLTSHDLQLPVSTTTVMDLPRVREHYQLRKGALSQVDVILK